MNQHADDDEEKLKLSGNQGEYRQKGEVSGEGTKGKRRTREYVNIPGEGM